MNYWYWENQLSQKDIVYLNNYVNKNYDYYEKKSSGAHNLTTGEALKNSKVKCIQLGKIKNKINHILEKALYIAQYEFGYSIFMPLDGKHLLYNSYSSKNLGHYNYHNDTSQSEKYDVKLTLLINISQKPYEGGEFRYFHYQENTINEFNKPGNAILLKSHLFHKVTPVTKGETNTLTWFVEGPKFR